MIPDSKVLQLIKQCIVRFASATAERKGPFLSPQPICLCEALCSLDDGELSGSGGFVCLQWHSLQSRIATSRRNIRDQKGHQGGGTHKVGAAGQTLSRKS